MSDWLSNGSDNNLRIPDHACEGQAGSNFNAALRAACSSDSLLELPAPSASCLPSPEEVVNNEFHKDRITNRGLCISKSDRGTDPPWRSSIENDGLSYCSAGMT